MKIIPAATQDISLIQELAHLSWYAHYPGIISQQQIAYMLEKMYSVEELQQHFKNPNFHYYLILDKFEQPIGFMGFELEYLPKTTQLHRLYLLEEAKGKGFGKLAMKFLKKQVAKMHQNRIILNVNKHNPSKCFYENEGFSDYNEGVFDIGNGFVMDDYLMEYHIN